MRARHTFREYAGDFVLGHRPHLQHRLSGMQGQTLQDSTEPQNQLELKRLVEVCDIQFRSA